MAQRDWSQGFGFIYVDIPSFLKEAKDMPLDFATPVETATTPAVPSVNLTKVASPEATQTTQVKKNLDRLQTLHHKLHALLEELNQMSKKK